MSPRVRTVIERTLSQRANSRSSQWTTPGSPISSAPWTKTCVTSSSGSACRCIGVAAGSKCPARSGGPAQPSGCCDVCSICRRKKSITPDRVHLAVQEAGMEESTAPVLVAPRPSDEVTIHTQRGGIRGRGQNQRQYLHNIHTNDLTFGIGPAGTGKTYLAVACAVEALQTDRVRRIVLVRPAVEAGERLGFLPGDIGQKVDPYLRPMYDALYDMMGFDRVARAIERQVIEIAPLAFMRGRSP